MLITQAIHCTAYNGNLLPEMHKKMAWIREGQGGEWGRGRFCCGVDYGMDWRAA